MIIEEVSLEEYEHIIPKTPHVFNTVSFTRLNVHKADSLHCFVFSDKKVRFGIIVGRKGSELYSPFSAPFGGLSELKPQKIEYVEEAVSLLKDYSLKNGTHIIVTLPPVFYNGDMIAKSVSAFYRYGQFFKVDLNYHFELARFSDYNKYLASNAKKNLQRGLKESFYLVHINASDIENVRTAYKLIEKNRREHNYPLRMSFEDVLNTIKIIPSDFFILKYNGINVASAMVFYVSKDICQVIYWGDIKGYSTVRPMNVLSYYMFKFYSDTGIRILDIGPSTENSIPNYGLCSFKESIGCSVTNKYTFLL